MPQNYSDNHKAGYVTIIGKPNAGKSTLLNQLLSFKLSIVSHKAQTTRKRVLGILSNDDSQAIFVDTPGLLKPQYDLQSEMMRFVIDSINDADLILLILDSRDFQKKPELPFENLIRDIKKPILLLLNKIDLLDKSMLLPLIDQLNKLKIFKAILPISALKSDQIDHLRNEVSAYLPSHPPYYDPELLTEQPERFFVSELIREQLFIRYKDEIPYSTEVEVEEFKDRPTGKTYIRSIIYVERDSQKGIIIGKGGAALKKIGETSRKNIEEFLDRKIFLELFVKVLPNWRNDAKQLKRLGYKSNG